MQMTSRTDCKRQIFKTQISKFEKLKLFETLNLRHARNCSSFEPQNSVSQLIETVSTANLITE